MSSRSNYQRLVALEKEMAAAAAADDFEKAGALRDEILRLKGESGGDNVVLDENGEPIEVSVGQAPPGQMGLGSDAPVRQPPKGWVKPKKPDFMTKGRKGR